MITDERLKIYVDRLFKEWMTYGKPIIGVDFDSTSSPYHTLNNDSDIDRTIKLLKECKITGCFIVIHTACREDRYDEIRNYFKSIGLEIDTINQTPIDLPYGKTGSKPYCNHFLDDRSSLPTSLDILEQVLYMVRGERVSKLSTDGVA
jgi:hypothetical protein